MARLDSVRERIAVSEQELEALRRASSGEPVDDDDRRALVDAGLLTADGALAPLVADLVTVATGPMLECLVEAFGPQGPTLARVVIREETVWYTDPWPQDDLDGAVVHHRDELPQILWILARLVGLRRRQVPAAAQAFTVPLSAVDAVIQTMALGEDQWEPARTVATARFEEFFAEVGDPDRTMLMATLSYLESAVRLTVAWGPGEDDARGIALWNCGPGGWWQRTAPVEPIRPGTVTPQTPATFVPIAAGDVWTALAGLLPTSAELRAVIDREASPS